MTDFEKKLTASTPTLERPRHKEIPPLPGQSRIRTQIDLVSRHTHPSPKTAPSNWWTLLGKSLATPTRIYLEELQDRKATGTQSCLKFPTNQLIWNRFLNTEIKTLIATGKLTPEDLLPTAPNASAASASLDTLYRLEDKKMANLLLTYCQKALHQTPKDVSRYNPQKDPLLTIFEHIQLLQNWLSTNLYSPEELGITTPRLTNLTIQMAGFISSLPSHPPTPPNNAR